MFPHLPSLNLCRNFNYYKYDYDKTKQLKEILMSELDKTIEELEAQVELELEEAKKQTDSAGKGDSMEKPEGEVEDLGKAVVDPKSTDSVGKKASAKVTKAAEPKAKQTKEDAELDHEGDDLEESKKMTKAEMLKAMYSKLEGMKATELKASYDSMNKEEDDDEDDVEEVDESTLDARLASVDVSEDVTALVQGEELSEEFKEKASTIFEAAVKSKLRSEVLRIEEAKTQEIAEEVESVRSELTEKVDAYMNYVVEEWMKENEIAIERGLKGEIAEDFISGLKSLFEEHYIDVPDEKYDILGQQSAQIDALEEKLNEQITTLASLKSEKDVLVRESVFAQVASDLADTEIEKFKSLAEDVEFTTEESFSEKLETLKESYFPKAQTVAESVDAVQEEQTAIDTTGAMSTYMSAISRNVKRAK
jgi:hypothetical protein